jgi:hypothetical protein
VRAGLQPLAPGERPRAVAIAAVVAAVLAAANLGFLAAGWEVDGQQPALGGVLVFSGLMLFGAVFMWRGAYWAVLGFQALLAIAVVFAFLSLLTASNLQGVVLCLGIMAVCGPLFWFLVRAMARLQMPRRPTRESR